MRISKEIAMANGNILQELEWNARPIYIDRHLHTSFNYKLKTSREANVDPLMEMGWTWTALSV